MILSWVNTVFLMEGTMKPFKRQPFSASTSKYRKEVLKMSVTQHVSETFEQLMESVPSIPVHAPTAITECRQAQVKKGPMAEARKKIDEASTKKKAEKFEAKKNLTEAAEAMTNLYVSCVMEGVLDRVKDLNPEKAEGIETFKKAIAEAALAAKDFLG